MADQLRSSIEELGWLGPIAIVPKSFGVFHDPWSEVMFAKGDAPEPAREGM